MSSPTSNLAVPVLLLLSEGIRIWDVTLIGVFPPQELEQRMRIQTARPMST